jgi:hypothetical protein
LSQQLISLARRGFIAATRKEVCMDFDPRDIDTRERDDFYRSDRLKPDGKSAFLAIRVFRLF